MKKKLTIILSLVACCLSGAAQNLATVLADTSAAYHDMKIIPGSTFIAGLRHPSVGSAVDILLNNGQNFSAITGSLNFSTDGYYERVLATTDHVYALGYKMQAIKVGNGVPTLTGAETILCETFYDCDLWNNYLLVTGSNGNSGNAKLFIVSLSDPDNPAIIDSLDIPDNSMQIMVNGNTLYISENNFSAPSRIQSYHLSAPPLQVTVGNSYSVSQTQPTIAYDITADQLIAITTDSVYRFQIFGNADLQLLNATPHNIAYGVQSVLAVDSNYLSFADGAFFEMYVQHYTNFTADAFDTIHVETSYFRRMGKLDNNNIFYTCGRSYLIHIGDPIMPAGIIENALLHPAFSIFPNPSDKNWTVLSKEEGWLSLYAADGKLVYESSVHAGTVMPVNVEVLPPGTYYYQFRKNEKIQSAGKLLKN